MNFEGMLFNSVQYSFGIFLGLFLSQGSRSGELGVWIFTAGTGMSGLELAMLLGNREHIQL